MWDAAMHGCRFALHVASPMGQNAPRGTDLVAPARDGSLRVLEAARRAGVGRVVVTLSTVAAQVPHRGRLAPVEADESVWTSLEQPHLGDCARAKTLAEQAIWAWVSRSGDAPTVTTVLPTLILGPAMKDEVSGSLELVQRLLSGRMPALPRIGFGVVDVRDLVDLHLRAMTSPAAAGQRYIASSDFLWVSDMARLLRDHLGPAALKVPRRMLPDLVLRLAAHFSQDARFMAPMLRVRREYSAAKARHELGWSPRPAQDALLGAAHSLVERGLVDRGLVQP